MNQPVAASSLFSPSYRGPHNMGQQGSTYNPAMNASSMGYSTQPYHMSVYNQNQRYECQHTTRSGQTTNTVISHGRGYQGRGSLMPPLPGQPSQFPPLGGTNPLSGYQQQAFAHQRSLTPPARQQSGRGVIHSGPGRVQPPAPRGGHRQPGPAPIRQPPAAPLPVRSLPPQAPRPAAAGRDTKPSSKPLGEDEFPSLGSQSQRQLQQQPRHRQQADIEAGLTEKMASASLQDPPKAGVSGRGGSSRRPKFVPFTDYDPSSVDPEPASHQKPSAVLPPPRARRNEAFRLNMADCYRGKIIFIDELSGIDYSNHPAIVRSINHQTKQIRFFKKSSFKGIGGFLNKYGEYVNQSQKRWHEKQWLLVDDGVTKPHHGTPLLKLANGEKMPEKGSYVDIHGDSELHIDYFSKYSRYGVFPDIFLPEEQMRQLEQYSEWYLERDEEYRAAEERKKSQRWQVDGSADVDVGDVYEDSENEADSE